MIFSPIYMRRGDVLTPETKREIVTHDEIGQANCGWKPPGK